MRNVATIDNCVDIQHPQSDEVVVKVGAPPGNPLCTHMFYYCYCVEFLPVKGKFGEIRHYSSVWMDAGKCSMDAEKDKHICL